MTDHAYFDTPGRGIGGHPFDYDFLVLKRQKGHRPPSADAWQSGVLGNMSGTGGGVGLIWERWCSHFGCLITTSGFKKRLGISYLLVSEHLQNVFRKVVFDFSVPGHRLRHFCFWVLVPIVVASVSNKKTSNLLQSPDQLLSSHATSRSALLRTLGMEPLVSSL